ncbi:MAG: hypothetical protein ACYCOU_00715 [Sulfobacillus sp.]
MNSAGAGNGLVSELLNEMQTSGSGGPSGFAGAPYQGPPMQMGPQMSQMSQMSQMPHMSQMQSVPPMEMQMQMHQLQQQQQQHLSQGRQSQGQDESHADADVSQDALDEPGSTSPSVDYEKYAPEDPVSQGWFDRLMGVSRELLMILAIYVLLAIPVVDRTLVNWLPQLGQNWFFLAGVKGVLMALLFFVVRRIVG